MKRETGKLNFELGQDKRKLVCLEIMEVEESSEKGAMPLEIVL